VDVDQERNVLVFHRLGKAPSPSVPAEETSKVSA
jgi:hypothetical protein